MTKRYTQNELEAFAEGMKKVADYIHMKKPDFILAPIIGAVPFIDALAIVDRHFPLESVEYPPNSSRFTDRIALLGNWYANFLDQNYNGEQVKVMCIDEVLSGSSASVGYSQFQRAKEELIMRKVAAGGGNPALLESCKSEIRKNIDYEILGIGELRKRNHNFSRLVNQKKAHVINLPSIITLDDVSMNPLRLKTAGTNAQNRQVYAPEIDRFETTPQYLAFLQDLASYVGTDPSSVSPVNIGRINESMIKYLSLKH